MENTAASTTPMDAKNGESAPHGALGKRKIQEMTKDSVSEAKNSERSTTATTTGAAAAADDSSEPNADPSKEAADPMQVDGEKSVPAFDSKDGTTADKAADDATLQDAAEKDPSAAAQATTPATTTAGGEASATLQDAAEKDPAVKAPATTTPSAEAPDANATTTTTEPPLETPLKQANSTNAYESLRWTVIRNDGTAESMIKLVGLKSLFAKQLPKMPRAYISRLVFDPRHTSVAILSKNPAVKDSDEEIIGGICYRAFEEMRFAEIAFCAVNATHQVKGYGTKLMNLLKKTGAETGIEFFITYADNYAIGYFKKQGFTKNITMPRGRYFGLIKDYDGGTPMECYVHPSIDFLRVSEQLRAQRDFILNRVRRNTSSRKVYDPLPKDFKPNLDGVSRANHAAARAMAIPGILEAGWTMPDLLAATGQGKEADRQKSALKSDLLALIRKIEEQQFAWPFREPVDISEVADYMDVVKEPIDLSTIEKRVRQDNHYKSRSQLFVDLMLMVNNCKLYNEEASTYVQCAVNLERFLAGLFHDVTAGRS